MLPSESVWTGRTGLSISAVCASKAILLGQVRFMHHAVQEVSEEPGERGYANSMMGTRKRRRLTCKCRTIWVKKYEGIIGSVQRLCCFRFYDLT